MRTDTAMYGEKYLARVGLTGSIHPDRDLLDELLGRHVATIPFENVDSYAPADGRLGVALATEQLAGKLLGAADGGPRRGGYCFEHAALLRLVLPAYGFDARTALGRVYVDPALAPGPKTHNATVVRLGERELLVDPGFGGMTPTASLDLSPTGTPQQTSHGTYRVVPMAAAGVDVTAAPDLDVMLQTRMDRGGDTQWINLYGLDLGPVVLRDIEALNWYIATAPVSPFVRRFAAALAPEGRRITIAGAVTRSRAVDGSNATTETPLHTVEDFAGALRAVGVDADTAAIERVRARLSAPVDG
ncbi:arylamine N-acetyltransferase family protein [Flexivirga oryzae]|uniref:N-hydroxyarylamine O-acetyltransferase n=1 Tax=Flexivirga oryzae TaxID=1794944 RepID=A0A839MYT0_9MICO|nr:arylamine N-acetyltransferase [Flexivirga oryzae]MBB2890620.1 N-hydroxyarylamine O-acetyltransferase [Flexivirga oryzae]